MKKIGDDWAALLECLAADEKKLAKMRDEARAHLDQANPYMLSEHGEAQLRWTYAGLPELWLQCEVIREQGGAAVSRVFLMNLD